MLLSKRERFIGMVTVVLIGVMAFYWLIFMPLSDHISDLDKQIGHAQDELDDANMLLGKKRSLEQQWTAMSRNALLKDESAAESRILNNVREWAQDAGVTLSLLRPERAAERDGDFFYRITVRATGNGTMSQISRFLYHIQTTSSPVRISDLSISSRKEGADDLTASLALATIYLAPETDRSKGNLTASAGTELSQ